MNYLSLLNSKPNSNPTFEFNNKFATISRKCSLKHWNHYFDKNNEIRIMILGRPVLEVSDWKQFKKSEKNFISKNLIKKYIELSLKSFCNQLNGAFSILIIDYKVDKILIITDKLGIYPLYIHGIECLKTFQCSSNLNFLVNNIKNKLNKDIVSISEFLKKGFIYHPNSFYKEIKTIDHASYCILDFKKRIIIKKKYFKFQFKPIYNFNELVIKLSKALKNSIERRTMKYFGKKVVLLSGGTDSRMILANSADKNIDAITLYNKENRETITARNIAKSLNLKHYLINRDKDYYYKSFNKSIQINGGRCLPNDDHFYNIKNKKIVKNYDTILTGCYADWLFKGIALNRKQLSICNIKLPFFFLKSFDYNFFSKRTLLSKKFENLIKNREKKIFYKKKSYFESEICRLFPLFQEETAATRLTLQQLFPWDSIFSDNDVIELYQNIPAKYKVNSEVYDKAVFLILNKLKNIPHAHKRHKIGINKYFGIIIYVYKFGVDKFFRLIKKNKVNPYLGQGSWLSKEQIVNKKFMKLWNDAKKIKFLKKILDKKDLKFNDILKDDYKLIFKSIVIAKLLEKNKKFTDKYKNY